MAPFFFSLWGSYVAYKPWPHRKPTGRVTFPNSSHVKPFKDINISLQICVNDSLASLNGALAKGASVFSINNIDTSLQICVNGST